MLNKLPEYRIAIIDVVAHPVISKLKGMLESSLLIEERNSKASEEEGNEADLEHVTMLGAVVEERASFLKEVFAGYAGESSVVEDGDDEMDCTEA